VRDRVLLQDASLTASVNDYDWLGHGIYFWEHGPERALDWAREQSGRSKLSEPVALGAHIHLGKCFDLLDIRYTKVLNESYEDFERAMKLSGKEVPTNQSLHAGDSDRLLRRLDCAMINWTLERMERAGLGRWDTVRGVFQEGGPAFPGSSVLTKSHIQIAVRNPACIVGYFRPM
jgi:hypothetical protein